MEQLLELVKGMGTKMASLDTKVETTASGIASLTTEVERSARRLQSVESRLSSTRSEGLKCDYCGGPHKHVNCPNFSAPGVPKEKK